MCRLICTVVVSIWHKQVFSRPGSYCPWCLCSFPIWQLGQDMEFDCMIKLKLIMAFSSILMVMIFQSQMYFCQKYYSIQDRQTLQNDIKLCIQQKHRWAYPSGQPGILAVWMGIHAQCFFMWTRLYRLYRFFAVCTHPFVGFFYPGFLCPG